MRPEKLSGINAKLWRLVFIVSERKEIPRPSWSTLWAGHGGDGHPVNGFCRCVSSGRLSPAVEGKGLESLEAKERQWERTARVPVAKCGPEEKGSWSIAISSTGL